MAPRGAVSRASSVVICPLAASYQTTNDPPPRPELSGSTRPRTLCTATIASAALPPASRTLAPASTASGLAAATIQSLPVTGRPSALAVIAARAASVSGPNASSGGAALAPSGVAGTSLAGAEAGAASDWGAAVCGSVAGAAAGEVSGAVAGAACGATTSWPNAAAVLPSRTAIINPYRIWSSSNPSINERTLRPGEWSRNRYRDRHGRLRVFPTRPAGLS